MANQLQNITNPVALVVEDDNINARLCIDLISRYYKDILIIREVTEDMAYDQIVANNCDTVLICLDNRLASGTGGALLARLSSLKVNYHFDLLPNCQKLVLMSAEGSDVMFDQALQLRLAQATTFPLSKGNFSVDFRLVLEGKKQGFTSSYRA